MRKVTVNELDKYIILDTQGGHEDIIGLVAALKLAAHYDRTVVGITCVKGRRSLDSCVRDALIAQQIAGTSIPVFKGKSILNLRMYQESSTSVGISPIYQYEQQLLGPRFVSTKRKNESACAKTICCFIYINFHQIIQGSSLHHHFWTTYQLRLSLPSQPIQSMAQTAQ